MTCASCSRATHWATTATFGTSDPAALPADCRNQSWVQPLTGKDVMKVLRKLLVRAGTGNFIGALVAANRSRPLPPPRALAYPRPRPPTS
jgi:hypothetical protein